ncbi:MAG: thiamine phosphate synthase [Bacteroidales bacterium]|jgi:thiamine-phosphate pyrophosphorylase|nr:thiamine phosphate synthase [Bacteroidales bacterium]
MQIQNIQYITQDHPRLSHAEQALAMFRLGVKWVQLRIKNATEEEIVAEAKRILKYAEQEGGTLILNDSVALAKKLGVKAVHLGLSDMPINQARVILGDDVVLGGTANTFEQIQLQVARGADYVGVGPFLFTTTKKNLSPTLGLDGYQRLLQQMKEVAIDLPLFCVGGVTMDDVDDLRAIGIHHFAISGDLLDIVLTGNNDKIGALAEYLLKIR